MFASTKHTWTSYIHTGGYYWNHKHWKHDDVVTGTSNVNNLNVSGNSILGNVNSLSVYGNITCTGSVISNFIGAPEMDPNMDWEGVWIGTNNNGEGFNCEIAFVKKPNNTYTVYTNDVADGNSQARMNKFSKYADNFLPTLTYDNSGNIIENSVTLQLSGVNGFPTTVSIHKRLDEPNSDYGFIPDYSENTFLSSREFYTMLLARRIMKPSDLGIFDDDWFEQYQIFVNKKYIESKGRFKVNKDVQGLWDSFKETMLTGPTLVTTTNDISTGEIKTVNTKGKKAFELVNMHRYLSTNKFEFTYPITDLSIAYSKTDNILQVGYQFISQENDYEFDPFVPFCEITLPVSLTNQLGISENFKFLPSFLHRTNSAIHFPNAPNYKAGQPYVGLLLPITIPNSNLTIDVSGGTSVTIDIPGGSYYPHSLAAKITQLLDKKDSDLRVDFYCSVIGDNYFTFRKSQNAFFYITSQSDAAVTVTSDNSSLLSDILGFDTITYYNATNFTYVDDNGSLVEGETDFSKSAAIGSGGLGGVELGVFPKYMFKGSLNPSITHTPLSVDVTSLDVSGNTVSTSFGNVTGSGNPRDLYSSVAYLSLFAEREIHLLLSFITMCSVNYSLYIPDTYKELVYKVDDLRAKVFYFNSEFNKQTDIDFAPFYSTHANEVNSITFLGEYFGPGTGKTYVLPQFLPQNAYTAYDNHANSFAYENYFDASNILAPVFQFTSDGTTNLVDFVAEHGGEYLTDAYAINNGFPQLANCASFGGATELPPGVTGTVTFVSIYNIPANSPTLYTYSPFYYNGYIVGIFKQSVVDKLLPDSGKIVGYYTNGYAEYGSTPNSSIYGPTFYRKLMCQYFNDNHVDCVLVDSRRHGGGYALLDVYYPFGSPEYNANYMNSTYFNGTSFYAPVKNDTVINILTFVADVHDHPEKWDQQIRDSLTFWENGWDFTEYDANGKTNVNDIKMGRFPIPSGDSESDWYVNGTTNGKGEFKLGVSTGSWTQSAGQLPIQSVIRQAGSNNDLGANTTATVMGTYSYFNSDYFVFFMTPPYGEANMLTDLDVTTFDPVMNMRHQTVGKMTTPTGEYVDNRYGPWCQLDATSNHDIKTLWTSLGYDSNSDTWKTGTLNSSNVNAYNINMDHPETWRDFNLERYIQATYAGPDACRLKPDFGYILNETLTTQDPLPRNIFDIPGLPTSW